MALLIRSPQRDAGCIGVVHEALIFGQLQVRGSMLSASMRSSQAALPAAQFPCEKARKSDDQGYFVHLLRGDLLSDVLGRHESIGVPGHILEKQWKRPWYEKILILVLALSALLA